MRNHKKLIIDLKEIVDYLELPSAEVIKMLEKLIINQKIQAHISIRGMQLVLSDLSKSTYVCEICTRRITESEYHLCKSCETSVCTDCYQEMESVGMTTCPGCGNILEYIS